jgi:hypothetical protein
MNEKPLELNPEKIALVVNILRISGVIIGIVAVIFVALIPRL